MQESWHPFCTPRRGAADLSAARIPPGLGWNVNHGDRDDDDDGDDDDGDDDDDDDIPPN